MITEQFIAALSLPLEARVDQRVPKKLLVEQGAPTAADKRQIQEGIEEVLWVAALKPSNIGIPAFRDASREYLEIAVIAVTFRESAKVARLTQLIHRVIPYPVVLVSHHASGVTLSLAHKRFSQAEAGGVVAEALAITRSFQADGSLPEYREFLASLAISGQHGTHLFALYQSWMDRIAALAAAEITGSFTLYEDPSQYESRRVALDAYGRLQGEIASLRSQAAKEKQLNRRVEINLAIKRLEAEIAKAMARLR